MSVEVSKISKYYGNQKALDEVSFSISGGQVVGFLGPNGAGKSTMMKILTCYLPPSSGTATVCGMDVMKASLKVRRKIGYLPENNPLYPEMYVKEYLGFSGEIYGLKNLKNRIDEVIEMVGLSKECHKKTGMLSKGYKQRVGLAQALLHDPEVLILDEPTTGLDPNQIIEIRQLIKNLGNSHTVLMSTHIMQEVEAVCNRVLIIDKGVLRADDTVQAVISSIKEDKSSFKVTFSAPVTPEMFAVLSECTVIREAESALLFTSSAKNVRQQMLQRALELNLEIITINQIQANLEDVFKSLTKN